MVAALAVPVGDHLSRLVIGGFRRVEQALRGVAVHHHLAADHEHVALHGLSKKGVGGGFVHGAIGSGRGGAVAQQLVIKMRGDALGMGALDEAAFFREGIGVQPFQQIGGIGADDLHLREMQVHVDEAGHDEMRPVVFFLDVFRRCVANIGVFANGGNPAVFEKQAAILDIEVALRIVDRERRAAEAQQAATQQNHAHSVFPSAFPAPETALSYQAVSTLRSSGVMAVMLPGGMAWLRLACK